MTMLHDLTYKQFAQQLHTCFQIEQAGMPALALELIEASSQSFSLDYESFVLVFLSPSDRFLSQSIYRFNHQSLGTFELFIVPIRRDADGLYYEAVFNRLRAEE